MTSLKKQILYCLEQYPETRNSDIELMIRVWQHFPPRNEDKNVDVKIFSAGDLFSHFTNKIIYKNDLTVDKELEKIQKVFEGPEKIFRSGLLEHIKEYFTDNLLGIEKKLREENKDETMFVRLKDLKWLQREDHIKRIRAKIQNEDKMFLPTDPAVIKIRKQLETKWRSELGYKTKEDHIDRDKQTTIGGWPVGSNENN